MAQNLTPPCPNECIEKVTMISKAKDSLNETNHRTRLGPILFFDNRSQRTWGDQASFPVASLKKQKEKLTRSQEILLTSFNLERNWLREWEDSARKKSMNRSKQNLSRAEIPASHRKTWVEARWCWAETEEMSHSLKGPHPDWKARSLIQDN